MVLEAWLASGQSLTVFAGERGVHRARLVRWKQRLALEDVASAADVLFFPVQLGKPAEKGGGTSSEVWTIELAGGVSVKVPCAGGAELLEEALVAVRLGWVC